MEKKRKKTVPETGYKYVIPLLYMCFTIIPNIFFSDFRFKGPNKNKTESGFQSA